MLHAILLGIFSYDRNVFVTNLGSNDDTRLRADILALAQQYVRLFGHQSEKDMPRLNKSKGITDWHITAKEYQGILLTIAVVCRSNVDRKLLMGARATKFRTKEVIKDWLLLLEMHLQWEAYLSQPRL